jgi:signal transduction histidine kinase
MATGNGPISSASLAALNSIVPAAMLGVPVVLGSGRLPFPGERAETMRFVCIQLGLGIAFSLAWAGMIWISWVLRSGMPKATVDLGRFMGWQILSGFWLYGIIASVSYAVRSARAAREAQVELVRAERARAQAELSALRAHLSPHFLFNTLHSLTGMTHDDPPGARHALQRLGDLLHYVLRLDRTGEQLVPLEEEWTFVRAFLDLERLRFGDRLQLTEEVDQEVLDCLVPPFVLQPSVENAVRHAVATRRERTHLRVAASADHSGQLHLLVSDNGPGADLAEVLSSRGLGLRAVRERLTVLQPLVGALTVETAPGHGFTVRVTLPLMSRARRMLHS